MTFEEAVEALGKTPEEVTDKLREMKVKGYRRQAGSCPIAKYLNECGFPYVTVATSAQCYYDGLDKKAHKSILLSTGVWDWIAAFDDGGYQEFYLE